MGCLRVRWSETLLRLDLDSFKSGEIMGDIRVAGYATIRYTTYHASRHCWEQTILT